MKLFRSTKHETRWFALSREIGWVIFHAEVDGWHKRQPARRTDRLCVHEVPLRLGFNTGIPGAPILASSTARLHLVTA
jgi:hypothetical protein